MTTYEESRDGTRAQWNEFSGGWKKWDEQVMEAFRDQGEALLDTLPAPADQILAREHFEMLMDCAAPIVSALRQAPRETQRKVQAALLEAIEADANHDGSLSLPWSAWLVTGSAPA